jgi:hypothetical protein
MNPSVHCFVKGEEGDPLRLRSEKRLGDMHGRLLLMMHADESFLLIFCCLQTRGGGIGGSCILYDNI